MKHRLFFVWMLVLILSAHPFALAEDVAEYRDSVYSFQYPASWKQGVAKDGSIVLEIPGTVDGVITFAIVTDLVSFTGDEAADVPAIDSMITQYSGKNLALNGDYELLKVGVLQGFRAFGQWAGSQSARMVCMTDGGHLVSFVLIGDTAIAAETALLESVVTFEAALTAGGAGYSLWHGQGYTLAYPEGYGTLEQNTGTVFMNPMMKDNMILARTYVLDTAYTDNLAPSIAQTYLPKSTHVEGAPEMTQIGDWSAAVIRGATASGPLEFYALGSDQTALVLLFMGDDAVTHAAAVVASVSFEK